MIETKINKILINFPYINSILFNQKYNMLYFCVFFAKSNNIIWIIEKYHNLK